jgi:N-acyl-D-aspartate/D-glutamate deacylase
LPAEWFGIADRGLIREGYFADLLVMRPESFRTDAVFRDPERYPQGLDMVFINGKVALDGEDLQLDPLPGKILRK